MLKIIQIYYDDASKANCYSEYTHHLNERCTLFCENSVMLGYVKKGLHRDCDYFGVVSHSLRYKTFMGNDDPKLIKMINQQANNKDVYFRRQYADKFANKDNLQFTPRNLRNVVSENKSADVFSLCFHPPHNPIELAERYHTGFTNIVKTLEKATGLPLMSNSYCNTPIYFNHWIARPEIYEDYVTNWLEPLMQAMESEPIKSMCMANSGYPNKPPATWVEDYGVNYWTFHTFVLERMISVYLEHKNYKVLAY